MAGRFTNTEHNDTIDSLVQGVKDIIKNPYYKWNDKSGTKVHYFNQNKEKTTLDNSTKLYYADMGTDSPIWYNVIHDFYIYGIDVVSISMDNGDFGPEASEISGEGIILPNTIVPYVGDYFNIDYTEENLLFRVIDVTTDTLENGSNIYKIQYKLESSKSEKILEEQNIADEYNMIIDNVGTGYNPIIRSEKYNLIKELEQTILRLDKYYKSVFYSNRVQTFIFVHINERFYDPYLIEFLRDNRVLEDSGDDFIYLNHQTQLSNLFPIKYDRTFFRCLELKDWEHIRSYQHQAVAEYISDKTSIFSNRLENYFEINYDVHAYNFGIIPCFKDEMIAAIEHKSILGGENSIYNIIIKYFHDEEITQEDIDELDRLDFQDNPIIFYAVPSIIFCIRKSIEKMITVSKNI